MSDRRTANLRQGTRTERTGASQEHLGGALLTSFEGSGSLDNANVTDGLDFIASIASLQATQEEEAAKAYQRPAKQLRGSFSVASRNQAGDDDDDDESSGDEQPRPSQTPLDKRQEHNVCERRRRDNIRSGFQTVQASIPHATMKLSKMEVLRTAIAYIKNLNQEISDMERDIKRMRTQKKAQKAFQQ